MKILRVTYSEIIMDAITVFQVAGNIPPDACSIRFNGTVYDLVPSYGGKSITLAIQGAHDLNEKEIEFVTKEDVIESDGSETDFRADDTDDRRE